MELVAKLEILGQVLLSDTPVYVKSVCTDFIQIYIGRMWPMDSVCAQPGNYLMNVLGLMILCPDLIPSPSYMWGFFNNSVSLPPPRIQFSLDGKMRTYILVKKSLDWLLCGENTLKNLPSIQLIRDASLLGWRM